MLSPSKLKGAVHADPINCFWCGKEYEEVKVEKNPEESLVHAFGKAGGYDVITSLGEVTIDAFMKEGILRDIPILGTLVGLGRAGIAVRDILFVKKLKTFLLELHKVPEEREKFVHDMESDPAERDRVGMHLMVLLERFEEAEKAKYLGRAFAAYLRGNVNLSMFLRMSRAIDRCLVEDLLKVGSEPALEQARNAAYLVADYQSCGFIEVAAFPQISVPEVRPHYKWTPFTKLFYEAVLKQE
jgi:hypothetical protein